MTHLLAIVRRLRADTRGATLVEFAIVAPVMVVLMMGIGDICYDLYAKAALNGALQRAARDSGIQGGATQTATIDAKVLQQVRQVMPSATYTSSRKSYANFSDIAPEPFTDTNGNGVRNPGECYTDVNGNRRWDADPGTTGQGGANDITFYTMTVTYPRLFPTAGLLGFSPTGEITAQSVLKNQPYASQAVNTPATVCT